MNSISVDVWSYVILPKIPYKRAQRLTSSVPWTIKITVQQKHPWLFENDAGVALALACERGKVNVVEQILNEEPFGDLDLWDGIKAVEKCQDAIARRMIEDALAYRLGGPGPLSTQLRKFCCC